MFLHLREEKTEQLLDCKQELEQMEIELKRLQQEVCTQNHNYIRLSSNLIFPFLVYNLYPNTLYKQIR